ncbi:FAD-dependent oxidoreductase [Streptomyces sp. NPDC051569]|uniref:FAD-dependent oxidoreductase n=1 Tax=Streptomyces sp. NPDC051569 TaxID=3365661 RepID=UPI003798FA8D
MVDSAGPDNGAPDRCADTDVNRGGGEEGDGADRSHGRRTRHAVVVGGSLAGLLVAHVLTGHADRVTIVERDRLPDGPEPRAGVPQSRHTHVLLEGGQRALDALLPGIVAELREHGAPRLGMPSDLIQWQARRFYRRTPAHVHILTGSRPQLEWLVRRRVVADPRITVVEGTEVVGLLGDRAQVRGVRLRERGTRTRQETRPLTADLVVDASGRGSRAPEWLSAIGAEPPREETLDTGLAYATRLYRAPADAEEQRGLGYYFVAGRDHIYGGVALPTENGHCLVTLSGLRGSEPPSDEAGFTDFAARLPHPVLHEWLLKAEPLSPVHAFRATANVRRRYDRPGRRPAGFLATGDALCAVNPVYGQGMAVAALGALALRDALADRRREPTTRRLQRAMLGAARQAWGIASGADRELPGARGDAARSRAADRIVARYLARVLERAPGDPVVGAAFRSVFTLTAPVSVLFAPRIVRAVLFGPVLPSPPGPPMRPESTETA